MAEHEPFADVELDQVGPGGDRRREALERVLRRERRLRRDGRSRAAGLGMARFGAEFTLRRSRLRAMAEPASDAALALDEDALPRPGAIEHAYRRERARRRARVEHREYARNSKPASG